MPRLGSFRGMVNRARNKDLLAKQRRGVALAFLEESHRKVDASRRHVVNASKAFEPHLTDMYTNDGIRKMQELDDAARLHQDNLAERRKIVIQSDNSGEKRTQTHHALNAAKRKRITGLIKRLRLWTAPKAVRQRYALIRRKAKWDSKKPGATK